MLRYGEKTDASRLDLNLFDTDETDRKKQGQEQEKKHQNRAKRFRDPNTSVSKKGNWILWIMLGACILAFLFITVSGKIALDRTNAESSEIAALLDEAMRENIRLQAVLEAMATPSNIEAYAAKHGLVKEQHSQVSYISVNVEKSIEVAEPNNTDALSKLSKWLKDKLEYFGY